MGVHNFKKDCIDFEPDLIVQKHLIDGSSYYFDNFQKGDEFDFKKEIASILNVHIRDVVIVGSGKLGFSLKPTVPGEGLFEFKKFDEVKISDLDIAIVSSKLFDQEMENLYTHSGWYKGFSWGKQENFSFYILKGRFAIRFLPVDFQLTKEIKIIQSKYKKKYARKINLEIYKSWFFFETYHKNNILNIKLNLLR